MKAKLVTFDVYMALLDIEGSLVPVVGETLGLDTNKATAFVRLWRAKQMERATSSNALGKRRTAFRECTAMALEYCLGHHTLAATPDTRRSLVFAWDAIKPWPEADAAVAAVRAKGCRSAILSNGDQDMLEAVARNFSPNAFDHVLSSETAGHYKPHPSVYALPTTALGIARSDIVHVAGSANDVLGAIAAGLQCIWSNRHADRLLDPAYPPTHEIPDLTGVAYLIDA
ncbi:MAG TPA: haloacid dehalogenase type II [Burkholderiales bacterium]